MEDRLYKEAQILALKYEFVDSVDELNILANALYLAMKWGREVI